MSDKLCQLADYHLMLSYTSGKAAHLDSVAILLIRPGDMYPDESGNHPGERFMELHITREKVNEIADQCNRDFEESAICALRQLYGQPEKKPETSAPAIVFFPAGSLGEEVES